ncbi:MAG: hypothetical protein O2807_06670 [bacterium]|nr:hypothetical protein [bacterium]
MPRPHGIPDSVGRYLVTVLKKNPDWAWRLMAVVRPRAEKKGLFDVRVYDAAQARGKQIVIRDFNSFDAHPELTLFEGWLDKNTNRAEVTERTKTAA